MNLLSAPAGPSCLLFLRPPKGGNRCQQTGASEAVPIKWELSGSQSPKLLAFSLKIHSPLGQGNCSFTKNFNLFFIILFLYWGYIVTFSKVLTMYISQIHLPPPFFFIPPLPE
jgi:hypothetical protein